VVLPAAGAGPDRRLYPWRRRSSPVQHDLADSASGAQDGGTRDRRRGRARSIEAAAAVAPPAPVESMLWVEAAKVTLNWSVAAGATGYNVFRGTSAAEKTPRRSMQPPLPHHVTDPM